MAKKYRKRPVVIEAFQLTPETIEECADLPGVKVYTAGSFHPSLEPGTLLFAQIETLEGVMTAQPGDYIITGVRGERYPCAESIFLETYEPVEDGEE